MTSCFQYQDRTLCATRRTPTMLRRERSRSFPRVGELKPAALLVDMQQLNYFLIIITNNLFIKKSYSYV